jgi:large subunit ribosomal protein L17
MRHQKKVVKLGLTAAHRKALLSNQVCSLIEHQRIKTTLAKAKAVRPLADKMVTLGKKNSLHARRTAFAVLRQKDAVKKLFDEIAPRAAGRSGGYTRIIKLGLRKSDAAPVALLEWVDAPEVRDEIGADEKAKKGKSAKKTAESPAKPERKTKNKPEEKSEGE